MSTTEPAPPQISIIVPARNEESCLADCLQSLASQTGVSFEIIVVDDHSTDHTRAIALSFPGVHVVEANPLLEGWTGKNNAVTTGAAQARGEWLLFTDADTIHIPAQIVTGFWETAVMPVIFAELASKYRPSLVSDPNSPVAAANGQYILVRRDAYTAVGGHAATKNSLLEDVELARAIKQSGRKIFFRYGGDAVRTRMYRTFPQLREGWTKNLAILFPATARLAFWRLLEFAALVTSLAFFLASLAARDFRYAPFFLIAPLLTFIRISRAHFPWQATLLAPLGIPLFSYLLLRSKRSHLAGKVSWKGRTYGSDHAAVNHLSDRAATTAGRLL